MKETRKTQIEEVSRLAQELHTALRGLAGPSGKVTSYWYGKPADWPEDLPWTDEEVARALNGLSLLELDEEWED